MTAERRKNQVSEPRKNRNLKGETNQMGRWSGQLDSNQRPAVPKTAALPGCAIPRKSGKRCRYTVRSAPARRPDDLRARCTPAAPPHPPPPYLTSYPPPL